MPRFYKKFFIFLLISIMIFGCTKGPLYEYFVDWKLERNIWKLNSCINNSDNSDYNITGAKYEFKKNGDLIIYPKVSGEIIKTSWELSDGNKYLRIGNNTFKIKIVTNKLLGLRFGNMDIYYVKAD